VIGFGIVVAYKLGQASREDATLAERGRTPIFTRSDGTEFKYGHMLLMYKTDFFGFSNFLKYMHEQGNTGDEMYAALLEVKQQFLISETIRNNGIVCIMIDPCQKEFYAVTDFSNPTTHHLFDDYGRITDNLTYNELWRVKFNVAMCVRMPLSDKYLELYFTNSAGGRERINFNYLTEDDLSKSPSSTYSRQFLDSFGFRTYLYDELVYLGGTDPSTIVVQDPDSFKGFKDTLCLHNEDHNPQDYCRSPVRNACYINYQICILLLKIIVSRWINYWYISL
jgi:hypothetical protein